MKKASFLIAFIALLFSSCCKENALIVQVNNPSALDRERESIEIKLDDIKNALEDKNDTACSFVVYDAQGLEIPSQLVLSSTPAVLLFQATVKAGDSCTYTIKKGEPMPYETMVQTTFMPRRKDDMSWENDKISFRMYGPALVTDPKEGMVSGGLDIWVKRTSKLVTQQWYQDEFDGKSTYHHDNGEGLDFYAVGTTLGAGALAPTSTTNSGWLVITLFLTKFWKTAPFAPLLPWNTKPTTATAKL